ncbi:hypothetical protein [Rhizobium leguminosarum]|uniref:hypothetical protein n=1 Tax=Rhizobium leguminosarum TaxID=384 RepID=UPI001FF0395A|nr:hypothetical protein [Rhizobium leguminosarum]
MAATDVLVVASINDLTTRHGFGPMAMPSPPNFQLFSLEDDPGGLWIAENDIDIVGFAAESRIYVSKNRFLPPSSSTARSRMTSSMRSSPKSTPDPADDRPRREG